MAQEVRTALRKPAVLAALGCSNSSLYELIARGLFPRPTKLVAGGRISVWFADEVGEFQKRASERQAIASKTGVL